jgi:hypothetical protein
MSFNNTKLIKEFTSAADQKTSQLCEQLNFLIAQIRTFQLKSNNPAEKEELQRKINDLEAKKEKADIALKSKVASNILNYIIKDLNIIDNIDSCSNTNNNVQDNQEAISASNPFAKNKNNEQNNLQGKKNPYINRDKKVLITPTAKTKENKTYTSSSNKTTWITPTNIDNKAPKPSSSQKKETSSFHKTEQKLETSSFHKTAKNKKELETSSFHTKKEFETSSFHTIENNKPSELTQESTESQKFTKGLELLEPFVQQQEESFLTEGELLRPVVINTVHNHKDLELNFIKYSTMARDKQKKTPKGQKSDTNENQQEEKEHYSATVTGTPQSQIQRN